MTKGQVKGAIRRMRKARGEEETILGSNPEAYLRELRNDRDRAMRIVREAGIVDEDNQLTARYR
jgi:hypothetical protein